MFIMKSARQLYSFVFNPTHCTGKKAYHIHIHAHRNVYCLNYDMDIDEFCPILFHYILLYYFLFYSSIFFSILFFLFFFIRLYSILLYSVSFHFIVFHYLLLPSAQLKITFCIAPKVHVKWGNRNNLQVLRAHDVYNSKMSFHV